MAGTRIKCGYSCCLGYSFTLLEECQITSCTNKFHHLCQAETEAKLGIDLGLKKRCLICLEAECGREAGNEDNDSSVGTSSLVNSRVLGVAEGNNDLVKNKSLETKSIRSIVDKFCPIGPGLSPQVDNLQEIVIPELGAAPRLKKQTGFIKNSVVLCPNLYFYSDPIKHIKAMSGFHESTGPYAYGKIVQVPNAKKKVRDYIVRYDVTVDVVVGEEERIRHLTDLSSSFPGIDSVKQLLKKAVERANTKNYRFNMNANRAKNTRKDDGSLSATSIRRGGATGGGTINASASESLSQNDSSFRPNDDSSVAGSSTLLSGILYETIREDEEALDGMETNQYDDDDSQSDDGSNCELDDSAFVVNDSEDVQEEDANKDDPPDSEETEINFMTDEWKWNNWSEIDDDESIDGPPEPDRYSGPHGLKPGVASSFATILQCIFKTTAMSQDWFKRLTSQSNKFARKNMMERNSTLYLGHKWKNITVAEMIRFFGIMLRISLEPRKMGGYLSYFTENPTVHIGDGYSIELRGFDPWAKEIMSLVRFKQIRSAFHPEAETSMCNDKCHQLRYFIRMFNSKAKNVFSLGPNVSFDEGGIAMRSRYCPVRQYNKDKPDKFRVDFFIMADAKHYFLYHLDVYQGKNRANIDIDSTLHNLPTTQKAVANAIVKSGIANDPDGVRYIFMDNRYAAPQLFGLMQTNYNIKGVGTCKANRKGFDSERLKLANNVARGTFKRLVDNRLGMVITRWKDSRALQVVSTIMAKGIGDVQRRVGRDKVTVRCPNDIIQYQKHMGGVDRGDQHRVVGAGFANVAHFKKWYKKAFLGICDFSLLQAFTAWNLGVNSQDRSRRGGVGTSRRELKKWEFYSVAAEEMMTYTDASDETGIVYPAPPTSNIYAHTPIPIPKNFHLKLPTCMICSMEEGVMRKITNAASKRARQYSRRKKHLTVCSDPNCNIICHSCCPEESKIGKIPQFAGLSCFEIAHHEECNNLFVEVHRLGRTYTRSITNHPIPKMVGEIYKKALPRRSERGRGRPRANEGNNNDNAEITEQIGLPPLTMVETRNSRGDGEDGDASLADSLVSNITAPGEATPVLQANTTRMTRRRTNHAARSLMTSQRRSNPTRASRGKPPTAPDKNANKRHKRK